MMTLIIPSLFDGNCYGMTSRKKMEKNVIQFNHLSMVGQPIELTFWRVWSDLLRYRLSMWHNANMMMMMTTMMISMNETKRFLFSVFNGTDKLQTTIVHCEWTMDSLVLCERKRPSILICLWMTLQWQMTQSFSIQCFN